MTGWVRNRADGSVEALLMGSRANVEAVISWTRVGPPGANVESVEVQWEPPVEDAVVRRFEIR